MLTIFFATGVGVAIVLYSTRSRRSVAPSMIGQSAAVQTYGASETIHASVTDAPVVEASSVYESQAFSEFPSATSELTTPTEAAAVAAPVEAMIPIVEPTPMMESQASTAVPAITAAEVSATAEKPRRVSSRRRSGTASRKTRAKPSQEIKTD